MGRGQDGRPLDDPAPLVKTADVAGATSRLSETDAEELKRLRREVRELRRANSILKDASVFFATELDGRQPK